jgi:hypothetical protein
MSSHGGRGRMSEEDRERLREEQRERERDGARQRQRANEPKTFAEMGLVSKPMEQEGCTVM